MTNLLHENVLCLRAGQNAFRVLLDEACINTPVFAETGRWFRMVSNPFARSNLPASFSIAYYDEQQPSTGLWTARQSYRPLNSLDELRILSLKDRNRLNARRRGHQELKLSGLAGKTRHHRVEQLHNLHDLYIAKLKHVTWSRKVSARDNNAVFVEEARVLMRHIHHWALARNAQEKLNGTQCCVCQAWPNCFVRSGPTRVRPM
jgi:hypothetical protein